MSKNDSSLQIKAKSLIFTAVVLWGISIPVDKVAIANIPFEAYVSAKYLLATLLFIVIYKPDKFIPLKHFGMLLIKLLINTVQLVLFYLALQKVSGVNVSMLNAVGPIVLFAMSIVLLHEKFRFRVMLGLLISLIGVGFMIAGDSYAQTAVEDVLVGNIMLIVAVLLDALTTIYGKTLVHSIKPQTIAGFTVGWHALVITALSFMTGRHFGTVGGGAEIWTVIVVAAVLFTFLPIWLFYRGLNIVQMQDVSIFNYINPVAGTIGSLVILGEKLSTPAMIGIGLVFYGLWISQSKINLKLKHLHVPFIDYLKPQ